MDAAASSRLGLIWESAPVEQADQRHVVRVVKKGTRLKSPSSFLVETFPAAGPLGLAVVLPIRLVLLLVVGQRYAVGVIRLGDDGAETLVLKERVRSEATARDRGSALARDLSSNAIR